VTHALAVRLPVYGSIWRIGVQVHLCTNGFETTTDYCANPYADLDALEGVNKHCDPAMAGLMERSRTGNILCSRFNNELRMSLEMWEDPRK
jgi:hypothetical protein